jgi:hypothetical protein
MRSYRTVGSQPLSSPVLADDLLEFHAARLLLLLAECGVTGRIDGLTKLAKLDFFVRYPQFFNRACERLGSQATSTATSVEASMVRYKYGPWDERYYHILPFLESIGLIAVHSHDKSIEFVLTDAGRQEARSLAQHPAYEDLVGQMRQVGRLLGKKTGSSLKKLIYELFATEVVHKHFGEVIR